MAITSQKKQKSKKSKIISFDEETITKDKAQKLLEHNLKERTSEPQAKKSTDTSDAGVTPVVKKHADSQTGKSKKRKRKKDISEPNNVDEITKETTTDVKSKKKKRNANKPSEEPTEEPVSELDPTKPEVKKAESIRERKRKKHAKLLEEKKSKVELVLQQKALNYLSKWKHSRQDWKFEKLRQIWLLQNMYDCAKVPDEFWDTIVEYLSNSKGKVREVLIKEALSIIEKEDSQVLETDEIKLKRARDIIQYLQE